MTDTDLSQPAIVFWLRWPKDHSEAVTRFERLEAAIEAVMQQPSAPNAPVAWIKTIDRHMRMDEIRALALGCRLAS
jgi:predicted RNA polymerase sigma factor